MNKILQTSVLLVVAGTMALAQHIVILKDGLQFQGRFQGGNEDSITFLDDHGNRHKLKISDVQSVIFSPSTTPTATNSSYAPGAAPPFAGPSAGYGYAGYGYADTDVEPNTGWTQTAVIPAGTEIAVRTIDPIDVRQADQHQQFLATVDNDVLDADGRVVIPRGSPAHLIVHQVGDGEVAVDLRSVNVDGKRYILNAQNVTNLRLREGPGANRRTGEYVGGAALLGTIIGAVAGGGKGAAVGALAGGAAGAGAQVLTRGSAVHIPPETVLRFRLDHPVYLYQ